MNVAEHIGARTSDVSQLPSEITWPWVRGYDDRDGDVPTRVPAGVVRALASQTRETDIAIRDIVRAAR